MNKVQIPIVKMYQGYVLNQILRNDFFAIYEQYIGDYRHKSWDDDKPTHYEVIRILRSNTKHPIGIGESRDKINDLTLPYREVYPQSEKWGIDGFTYTNKEQALKKYEELTQRGLK